jgi:hypothetical protein
MTRVVVSSQSTWDEYPALRVGRLYRGEPDVSRHPSGEIHLVEGPDAVETLCGLPRTPFPHDFPAAATPVPPDSCSTCRAVGE